MKIKKRILLCVFISLLTALFLLSSMVVGLQWWQAKQSKDSFEQAIALVAQANSSPTTASELYSVLLSVNADFVGWLSIKGTQLNYPVVQSIGRPNHYLHHGFNGEASPYGVPYVDERCHLDSSDNITIYGHNMANGSMFHTLLNYADKGYYEQHPIISFDTLSDFEEYAIIAAFRIDVASGDFFYTNYITMNEMLFDEYITQLEKTALYDTGVDIEYGDTLLTLSTCEDNVENGRFVVVAKKIQ